MQIVGRGSTVRAAFTFYSSPPLQPVDPDEFPAGGPLFTITRDSDSAVLYANVPYTRRVDVGKFDLDIPITFAKGDATTPGWTDGQFTVSVTNCTKNSTPLVDANNAAPTLAFAISSQASAIDAERFYVEQNDLSNNWGVDSPTEAEIRTAQNTIDAWLHRSLWPTVYELENHRIPEGRTQTMLDVKPVMQLLSADGRYGLGRHDRRNLNMTSMDLMAIAAVAGGTPPRWLAIDITKVDLKTNTGEIWLPMGFFIFPYTEIRVTYMAGLLTIPDSIKNAVASTIRWMRFKGYADLTRYGAGKVSRDMGNSLIPDDAKAALFPYQVKTFR